MSSLSVALALIFTATTLSIAVVRLMRLLSALLRAAVSLSKYSLMLSFDIFHLFAALLFPLSASLKMSFTLS